MPNPPHKVSRKLKRKVAMLVATGMSEREIAVAIKVSRCTLREHYADQLENGRALFRAELMDMLQSAADKGNVTAMKHLHAHTFGEVPIGSGSVYISKKKLAEEAAKTAGGEHSEWGDDLRPPRSEVN